MTPYDYHHHTYMLITSVAAVLKTKCPIHTADATQLDSWVASAVCIEFATSSRRNILGRLDIALENQ